MPVKKSTKLDAKADFFGEETNQDEPDDFGCVSLDHSDKEDGTTGKQTTSCIHSFP